MWDMVQNLKDLTDEFPIEDGFDFLKHSRSDEPSGKKIEGPDNGQIERTDLILFRLDEITFEEESPKQEALENVLASLRHTSGINFIYLILGNATGVNFYFGLSRELDEEFSMNLREWGESILKPSLEGNFRGSSVHLLSDSEQDAIVKQLFEPPQKYYATLEGVPGINKDAEKKTFQGLDRLIDVMLGDNFGFMVIAYPLSQEQDIQTIENDLYYIYNKLNYAAKCSIQHGTNQTNQKGSSRTIGKGASDTEGYSRASTTNIGKNNSISENKGKTEGTNSGESTGGSERDGRESWNNTKSKSYSTSETGGETHGDSSGDSKSNTHNISYTAQTNESVAVNNGEQSGTSETVSLEITHKKIQEWLKYFDEFIFPRLDYGRGKGVFVASTLLWAENIAVLKKLADTATGLFAGEQGNHVPFKAHFEIEKHHLNALRHFQQPLCNKPVQRESKEWLQEIIWQHCYRQAESNPRFYLGNWISVKELAVLAGIPQKEVVGLRLKEEVEFGLNVPWEENASQNSRRKEDISEENIYLGNLVMSGNTTKLSVIISLSEFDRHIFVTGVTGSGKTVTCQNLLVKSSFPFLVIEPAKTEYRNLLNKFDDLEVFTIGIDTAPFRLNPFHFFEGENISSRVDMIKASIEAAFDMEAAIPQLI
jgi:hypothetical protein